MRPRPPWRLRQKGHHVRIYSCLWFASTFPEICSAYHTRQPMPKSSQLGHIAGINAMFRLVRCRRASCSRESRRGVRGQGYPRRQAGRSERDRMSRTPLRHTRKTKTAYAGDPHTPMIGHHEAPLQTIRSGRPAEKGRKGPVKEPALSRPKPSVLGDDRRLADRCLAVHGAASSAQKSEHCDGCHQTLLHWEPPGESTEPR
jgi:hypothetical protein